MVNGRGSKARRLPGIVELALLAMIAGLALAIGCDGGGSPPMATNVSAEELASRIAAGSAPTILDVRSAQEFEAGHLPDAIHVPYDELAERLADLDLDPTAEIVVHCESGRRAAEAEAVLARAGFERVRDLEGHMQGWRADGRALE